MINVSVRTTTERKTVMAAVTATIAEILQQADIDTTGKVMQLNGSSLQASELGKPLSDFGIADNTTAMLSAVVKADSAR